MSQRYKERADKNAIGEENGLVVIKKTNDKQTN